MISEIRRHICLWTFLLVSSSANAAYYADTGSIFYDGNYFMSTTFRWTSTPGPWIPRTIQWGNWGYEHEVAIQSTVFFSGCSSVTNLPTPYDDCRTAGVLEVGGTWVFSFGAYDGALIRRNTLYTGSWTFHGHSGPNQASGSIRGHRVENNCWGYQSIWCYSSNATHNYKRVIYNWQGTPTTFTW